MRPGVSAVPKSLEVTHVAVSGATYARHEQYSKNASLTHTSGKTEYFWTGTNVKNSAYTMKGSLIRTAEGKCHYYEQLFRNGKSDYVMRSICHRTENE
jgi:hypothetical protein